MIIFAALPATGAWGQAQGEWSGATSQGGYVYFAVGGGAVQNFQMVICLSGGAGGFGCFEQVMGFGMAISGGAFSYTGVSFELTGSFTGSTTCSGTWQYHDGYRGYGSGTWSAGFGAPPVLELEPLDKGFPDQAVNTAGNPVSFYLHNRGGGWATGSVSLTGANADQFDIVAGEGSFSLSHDQSRQISVRFKPTVAGQKAAALTADADPPADDVSASLSGTATNPTLSVEPVSLAVPAGGGSFDFTVSNQGTGVLNWTATVDPASTWLAIPGKSSGTGNGKITLACEPNYGIAGRTGSFTVTAAGAANSPLSIEISQAEGVPALVFSPASQNFGKGMAFTSSDPVLFTLTNQGGGIASGEVFLTGLHAGEYEIAGGGGGFSLAPNAGKEIAVRFSPISAGAKTAALTAALDSGGMVFSAPLAGTATRPEWKLTAADGETGGQFGFSVAIDGDTAVVGAMGIGAGSAYIFQRSAGGWVQRGKLTPSNGSIGDHFGWSVDIDGDIAVVGASGNAARGTSAGMVYLFEKPPGGWSDMTEATQLTGADTTSGDNFGGAVGVSGTTVLVGADGDDDKGNLSGSAYVFEREQGGWTQMAKLTAGDGTSSDHFGRAVSISGDSAIVGADGNAAAYVFKQPASGWADMAQTAKLTASDAASGDYFAWSVSISGDCAMVGAKGDYYNGAYAGAAYVYERPQAGWVDMGETAKLTPRYRNQLDSFGASVGLYGDSAIAGSPGFDGKGYSSNTGSAGLFRKPAGGWAGMTETVRLTASDAENGDSFGYAVAISGDYAIASAYWDDDMGKNSGSVYIYYVRNFPPTISAIPDQTLVDDVSAGPIDFTVYDSETPAADLTLSVSSSNGLLVPEGNIVIEGTGWYRTVTVSAAPGQAGTAAVTVTVGDGQDTAQESFSVSVLDRDGDGLPDPVENRGCTDAEKTDTDQDGLGDGLEDADRDGEVDSDETDPCLWDTDGDGIGDGLEDANRNGLVDPGETDPLKKDTDGDGLSDGQEDGNRNGIRDPGETDPGDWDSDDDGCSDQDEQTAGSNPLSEESIPCIVCVDPAGACGDCAGSFECAVSIGDGIDLAVAQANPAALLKIFSGHYEENIAIPNGLKVVVSKGPVTLAPPD